MVTVASAFKSSNETGNPTMLLLPTTTALFPFILTPLRDNSSRHAWIQVAYVNYIHDFKNVVQKLIVGGSQIEKFIYCNNLPTGFRGITDSCILLQFSAKQFCFSSHLFANIFNINDSSHELDKTTTLNGNVTDEAITELKNKRFRQIKIVNASMKIVH